MIGIWINKNESSRILSNNIILSFVYFNVLHKLFPISLPKLVIQPKVTMKWASDVAARLCWKRFRHRCFWVIAIYTWMWCFASQQFCRWWIQICASFLILFLISFHSSRFYFFLNVFCDDLNRVFLESLFYILFVVV